MSVTTLLRETWLRLLLRGVHYRGRHAQFDLLYRVPDPWGLDCAREHHRFEATNAIILREFGQVGSLLEVGCGEGLQSAYLAKVCRTLRGIDISPTAAARAQARCPGGVFGGGDIMAEDFARGMAPADLIVACEVLYYIRDVPAFIARLSALGRACLISFDAAHAARLQAELGAQRMAACETVRYGGTDWVVCWWHNPGVPGAVSRGGSDPSRDRLS